MVERVARAIMKARNDVIARGPFDPTRMSVDERVLARAAIEAMREPTELMFMRGGNAEPYNRTQTGRMRGRRIGDKPARDCWRIMIDTALNERLT